MTSPQSKHALLARTILLLLILGPPAALADEPTVVEETETADSLSKLLIDILGDPDRTYARYHGLSDCSTERVYQDTRAILQQYASAPAEHQAALRHYLESSKEQCNCARSIIGKDFDMMVDAVGSEMSQVPCP
jgi:hypothetical protein